MNTATEQAPLQTPPRAIRGVVRILLLVIAVVAGGYLAARVAHASTAGILRNLPITILPGLVFILPRLWTTRMAGRLLGHVVLMAMLIGWTGWLLHLRYGSVMSLAGAVRAFGLSVSGLAVLCLLADLLMPRFRPGRAVLVVALALLTDAVLGFTGSPFIPYRGMGAHVLARGLFLAVCAVGLVLGEWLDTRVPSAPGTGNGEH